MPSIAEVKIVFIFLGSIAELNESNNDHQIVENNYLIISWHP